MSSWQVLNEPLAGLWYFAHHYSAWDETGALCPEGMEQNFQLCCRRAAHLIEAHWHIYAPVSHTHPIKMAYPPFAAADSEQRWYDFDNYFIEAIPFAGLILAPGWEQSRGCRSEKERFAQLGCPVLYFQDPCNVWASSA